MKYIQKGEEPAEFTDWKNQANEDWQPTYDNLSDASEARKALIKSLQKEQGYICCYCERKIIGLDFHIEHFRPKDRDKFPELQLVYDNLLCCCQRNLKKGDPRHCGNSKDNWFDENLLISPLDLSCEARFKYTHDGQILSSSEDDDQAETTINRLQLKIDKLQNLRREAIEPFLDEELSPDELELFVQGYLVEKDQNNGHYNEFYTTIKYLFGN